ncbi:AzlC family ABC transporter permease [Acidisoma sp.]|uniref:AzlC family ABC transporter permease n=1 Tax=Acidisoma sp. TaxID=1872115 RepID=UPI003AFFCBD7
MPHGPLRSALLGARDVSPLAVGVVIYGLAFGLLAAQAGFNTIKVGVMGLIVFAGGSQIVAAQQMIAGAGAVAAVIAGLALNLRLILVTASVHEVYAGRPWWQIVLGAHVTTDENWALMLAQRAKGRPTGFWYLVGAGVCLLLIWPLATMAGVIFARAIPDPKSLGMDFAFTAAFIAIARSLWKGRSDLMPWLTAVVIVAVSIRVGGLPPSWTLIIGGAAGATAAAFSRNG